MTLLYGATMSRIGHLKDSLFRRFQLNLTQKMYNELVTNIIEGKMKLVSYSWNRGLYRCKIEEHDMVFVFDHIDKIIITVLFGNKKKIQNQIREQKKIIKKRSFKKRQKHNKKVDCVKITRQYRKRLSKIIEDENEGWENFIAI